MDLFNAEYWTESKISFWTAVSALGISLFNIFYKLCTDFQLKKITIIVEKVFVKHDYKLFEENSRFEKNCVYKFKIVNKSSSEINVSEVTMFSIRPKKGIKNRMKRKMKNMRGYFVIRREKFNFSNKFLKSGEEEIIEMISFFSIDMTFLEIKESKGKVIKSEIFTYPEKEAWKKRYEDEMKEEERILDNIIKKYGTGRKVGESENNDI